MSAQEDAVDVAARLRALMGDMDRAVIDLRRLQIAGSVEVRFAVDPCKPLAADLATALYNLLAVLEDSVEYIAAVDARRPENDK